VSFTWIFEKCLLRLGTYINNIKFSVQFNIIADNYKTRNQHTRKITNLAKTVTLHFVSICNTNEVQLLPMLTAISIFIRSNCYFWNVNEQSKENKTMLTTFSLSAFYSVMISQLVA